MQATLQSIDTNCAASTNAKTPAGTVFAFQSTRFPSSNMIQADQVEALAAAPDGKIHEKLVQKKPVGDNEVGIRVTHSGVCATDLHYLDLDMVLGHEGREST